MINPTYFINTYILNIYLFTMLCQNMNIEKVMDKIHKFIPNIFTDINIESDELANAIVFILSRSKIRSYLASHEYSKEERYRIELDYSTFEKGIFFLNNMVIYANKSYARNKRWILSIKFLYPTRVSKNEIKKFFNYCKQEYDSYLVNNDKEGKISLYVWNNGSWKIKGQIPKRNSNTVIGDSSNSIIKDVMIYENSKTFYNTRQIPYKRGYILYGPPGTGKTTIIKMVASTFNKNIYKISIDENTTSLKSLISNVDSIYNNSILLIEDIDRLFSNNKNENYNIMSDFLNLLDGLDSIYNCMTFITTNNYELLKANFAPEFFRPGRIDIIKEVGYLSQEEIIDYFLYFYSIDKKEELLEKMSITDIKLDKMNNNFKKCKGLNELLYNFVVTIYVLNKENKKIEINDTIIKEIINEGLKEKKSVIQVYNTLLDLEKGDKMKFYKNIILKTLGKHLAENIEENKRVTFAELQNYLLFFKKNPFDPILDINIKKFRYNNSNLISNDEYLEYVTNLEKNPGYIENEKKKTIEYNGDIVGLSDILYNIIKKIFNLIYVYVYQIIKYSITRE